MTVSKILGSPFLSTRKKKITKRLKRIQGTSRLQLLVLANELTEVTKLTSPLQFCLFSLFLPVSVSLVSFFVSFASCIFSPPLQQSCDARQEKPCTPYISINQLLCSSFKYISSFESGFRHFINSLASTWCYSR